MMAIYVRLRLYGKFSIIALDHAVTACSIRRQLVIACTSHGKKLLLVVISVLEYLKIKKVSRDHSCNAS